MSLPVSPLPARPFLSILSAQWSRFWPMLRQNLEALLGPVDYESELIPFTQTTYYDAELGAPIFRRILSFSAPLAMNLLSDVKLATNALEQMAVVSGQRLFNLDPGYVTQERLVLATGKNFSHRIYLSQGIWADLTLIFHKGAWMDLPWTFPDYATKEIKEHLTRIRSMYQQDLKTRNTKDKTCPKA